MADLIRHSKSNQAEIYLEDKTLVGIALSFTIPKIDWETVEHSTLGQIAALKTPGRTLNALEGSMTLQFPEPELMATIYNPTHMHKLQLHQKYDASSADGFDAENSFTYITIVDVRFHGVDGGDAKRGDEAEMGLDYTCSRLIQRIHGREGNLLEVDVFANKVRNSSGDFWT